MVSRHRVYNTGRNKEKNGCRAEYKEKRLRKKDKGVERRKEPRGKD